MQTFLTGAGHFGFGFVVGSVICLCLLLIFRKRLFVQLYAPFVPFILGAVAVVPYSFLWREFCELPVFLNVFFFYSWAHCQPLLIGLFGHLHLVVVICGLIYSFIILRYILLVKRVRRHGWPDHRSSSRA